MFYALRPTGQKRWIYQIERRGDNDVPVYSSPAIGPDGTIYFGCDDTQIHAVASGSQGLADTPWPMRGMNARHTGRVGSR